MGRNAIPKIGEWRDGFLYEVEQPPGGLCVLKRTTKDKEEYLAAFWPDGFEESVFSAWFAGFSKGQEAGRAEMQREIQKALGIVPTHAGGSDA